MDYLSKGISQNILLIIHAKKQKMYEILDFLFHLSLQWRAVQKDLCQTMAGV
jgi:hypothetical protein